MWICKNCDNEQEEIRIELTLGSRFGICPQCTGIMERETGDTVEFTPDFALASWDKGAYAARTEPKLHKPISPPEEDEEEKPNLVCRDCIYCMRVELPPRPKIVQFVCKKYPVDGELINQYPDPIEGKLDETQNWCGKGEWLIGEELVSVDDVNKDKKDPVA